jgi:hypothetical protein
VGLPGNLTDAADRIHSKLGRQNGKRVVPIKAGMPPDFPHDVRSVVTVKPLGDNRTEMTITECSYMEDQWFDLSNTGLQQCLDKMAASVAKEQHFCFTGFNPFW